MDMLEIEQLSKFFPVRKGFWGRSSAVVKAVDRVSLKVSGGETFALIGESGSGKTTLARMIAGLIAPSSGQANFDKAKIVSFRRDVQIVFQNPFASLDPRMRVGQIIAEPLEVHRLASGIKLKQRVEQLLAMVELEASAAHRLPAEFSGGQRQRICIARALASSPRFLILDEPLSSLDLTIQARMLDLLLDLKRKFGLTYFFITHNLCLVKRIAQRVAVMKDGRIVEEGETARVFSFPEHEYTKSLLLSASGG